MPLDRVITVTIAASGMIPEASHEMWADRIGIEQERLESTSIGGAVFYSGTASRVTFRVRWRRFFETVHTSRFSITDDVNVEWRVDAVEPEDDRRRYVNLQCTRTT